MGHFEEIALQDLTEVLLWTKTPSYLFSVSGWNCSSQLCIPIWHLLGVCLKTVVPWECYDSGQCFKESFPSPLFFAKLDFGFIRDSVFPFKLIQLFSK